MVFARARLRTLCALASATIVAACGGEQGTPLPGRATLLGPMVGPDPGSAPADCTADSAYELLSFDDFEFGAATGWYTNNEICKTCPMPPDEFCSIKCKAIQPSPSYFDDPLPAIGLPMAGAAPASSRCTCEEGRSSISAACWACSSGSRSTHPVMQACRSGRGWRPDRSRPRSSRCPTNTPTPNTTRLCRFRSATPRPTSSTTAEGCDKYGSFVIMNPNWRFFRLAFDEMRQKGFGKMRLRST